MSSCSSSDESDNEDEVIAQAEALVRQNPADYSSRVALIKVLRKYSELDKLRRQREALREQFPLSVELWTEWIEDESSVGTSVEELRKLFELALNDYNVPSLWRRYLEVVNYADDIVKRSLEYAVYDVEQGPLIIADLLANNPEDTAVKTVSALLQTAAVLADAQTCADLSAASVRYVDCDQCLEYVERGETPLGRVRCLFERLVSVHCLEQRAWLRYATYLTRQKLYDEAQRVLERALRNVPWSTLLWQHRLLTGVDVDANSASIVEDIMAVMDRALSALPTLGGEDLVDMWLVYAAAMRVRVPSSGSEHPQVAAAFQRATTYMSLNSTTGDPTQRLLRASAQGDSKAWDTLLIEQGFGASAHYWQLRAVSELGAVADPVNPPDVTVYAQAMLYVQDDPVSIWRLWRDRVLFDRRVSISSVVVPRLYAADEAMLAWYARQRAVQEEAAATAAAAAVAATVGADGHDGFEKERQEKRERKECERAAKAAAASAAAAGGGGPKKGRKRARDESEQSEAGGDVQEARKKRREEKRETKRSAEVKAAEEGTLPTPQWLAQQKVVEKRRQDERTVYVSELPESVDEAMLRGLFEECGEVEEVRITRNAAAKTAVFAHVRFASGVGAVETALAMRGRQLGDCAISVTRALHAKSGKLKGEVRDVPEGEDATTLFVSRLSQSVRREQLIELFAPYGNIVDVRLITDRSGRPKGIAYVQFDSKECATAALALHETQLNGAPISVLLSNPSLSKKQRAAKTAETATATDAATTAVPPAEITPAARAAQLSLVPRRVHRATAPAAPRRRTGLGFTSAKSSSTPNAKLSEGGSTEQGGGGATASAVGCAVAKKSNDEFRKLFVQGQSTKDA